MPHPSYTKAVLEGQKKQRSKYHFEGGLSGSDISGPDGFVKKAKDAFKEKGDKDVDRGLNRVLSKMNRADAKKYKSRPKYSK